MKKNQVNNVLPQIIELQRQAREEIKNGSIELGKALLKKAQEMIDALEMDNQDSDTHNDKVNRQPKKDKAA